MKSFSSETQIKHVIDVPLSDRWQVYHRLNELDIPCHCESNQPLLVEIANSQIAVQVWSVVRQFRASRQDLICCLEDCWRIRCQTL